jgi:hypothetical protein
LRRREEKRKWGGSEEGAQGTISPILKVPRQCPLVLVEALNIIGINFFM